MFPLIDLSHFVRPFLTPNIHGNNNVDNNDLSLHHRRYHDQIRIRTELIQDDTDDVDDEETEGDRLQDERNANNTINNGARPAGEGINQPEDVGRTMIARLAEISKRKKKIRRNYILSINMFSSVGMLCLWLFYNNGNHQHDQHNHHIHHNYHPEQQLQQQEQNPANDVGDVVLWLQQLQDIMMISTSDVFIFAGTLYTVISLLSKEIQYNLDELKDERDHLSKRINEMKQTNIIIMNEIRQMEQQRQKQNIEIQNILLEEL